MAQKRTTEKPVPEDFGMTRVQYINAVAEAKAEQKQRRKVCNRWDAVIMLLGLLLGLGLAIHFSMADNGPLGVLLLLGTVVGTAYISVVLRDFYMGRESSSIASMRWAISRYEEAVTRYELAQQDYWKSLRGTKCEQALAGLYKKMGYSVRKTKASGDEGIDLILSKDGKTTIVQCKGHEKPIGVHAVRELYGTMMHHRADSAVLACPAGFTQGTVQFARNKPIRLVSASELVEMAESVPLPIPPCPPHPNIHERSN